MFPPENISATPDLSDSSFLDMDDIQIDIIVVAQLLQFRSTKDTGLDRIPIRFVNKMFAMESTPCLTLLYQASLDMGIVLLDWKKAFVVSIYICTRREIVCYQETTTQYISHACHT